MTTRGFPGQFKLANPIANLRWTEPISTKGQLILKRLVSLIVEPWRSSLGHRVNRKHKAVLLGVISASVLIYAGMLVFQGSGELGGRSVFGVFVSPDRVQVRAAEPKRVHIEKDSFRCIKSRIGITEVGPLVGTTGTCINWQAVEKIPTGCSESNPPLSLSTNACLRVKLQGDYRYETLASSAVYRGYSRLDAVSAFGGQVVDVAVWLATLLGILIAIAIGASLGYRYLRSGDTGSG